MPEEATDIERLQRSQACAAKRWQRQEQLREELAVYADDLRAGRFLDMRPAKPAKPMPWDGVKNSQIIPIGG